VDDRAIVQALRDRNRDGLAAAYDRYAQRLYDYCVGLLQDSHTAADAVHDTLLVAADRAQQLRDPDRFRSWLYAIARNECLRQLRQRNRLAPLEKAGDVKDDTVDLVRTVQAEQARALVRDAVAALNPREQEVLNLTLRHELSGAELAAALGVSANHAHALTSKAREQLERSVGALLTARTGRADCGELNAMLTGWDGGAFTPLLRKRVSRHLEKCAVCGARRAHEVRAEALFAAIPFALLPIALRRKVLDSSADLQRVSHHGRIAAPYQRDGFPVPLDQTGKRSKAAAWLAGAAVMALLVGGGVALNLRPGSQQTLAEPPAQVTPTSEEPVFTDSPAPLSLSPSASPSPSPSRSVSPTPSASPRRVTPPPRTRRPVPPRTPPPRPTPSRSTSPSPSRSPSPRPPLPKPDVTNPRFEGGCSGATASATVTGPPISSVIIRYWPTREQKPVRAAQLFPDGQDYFGRVGPEEVFYSVPVTFEITARAINGETDTERGNTTIFCIE
jgi:RNA polymerase sigma factor (sigma-70 family)